MAGAGTGNRMLAVNSVPSCSQRKDFFGGVPAARCRSVPRGNRPRSMTITAAVVVREREG